MEEIDNIIIESLRFLQCNIEDDIKSIKSFNPDMVVDAVASCLEIIIPGISLPHKLPPSMSLRLKLATRLSENIKELGFRGDIGYQTILYCNEVEVRRILMFLIERLPKESDEDAITQQIGYIHNLISEIKQKVELSFQKVWIPTLFLYQGVRDCGNNIIKSSYNFTYPLKTENMQIASIQNENDEGLKNYSIYYIKDVTKQCYTINLIQSLLFKDVNFSDVKLCEVNENSYNSCEAIMSLKINISQPAMVHDIKKNITPVYITDYKMPTLLNNVEHQKQNIIQLKEEIRIEKSKLAQISGKNEKETQCLKDVFTKYKIKSRTLTILSKEDNLEKLKNLVQNGAQRLADLESQWKDVQTPLLMQYETLISSAAVAESKQQEELKRMKNIKEKKQQLLNKLKEKEKFEKLLKQEHDRLNKNTMRSAYTQRILEIIGNIKKQNEEIQKILNDTKSIQKNINSLQGQLDRSFTLSDELIFRNAKQDEISRKAYKLLATLHNDCGAIIQAITEIGITERESRNLQEQIDIEVDKATSISLKQANADLQNIKRETTLLLK